MFNGPIQPWVSVAGILREKVLICWIDSSVWGVPSSPRITDTSSVTAWQTADTVGTFCNLENNPKYKKKIHIKFKNPKIFEKSF